MATLVLGKLELDTLFQDVPFLGDPLAVYPRGKFLAQANYSWDVALVSIQFSTSLVVFPGMGSGEVDYGGLFITVDQPKSDFIAVSANLRSVVDHHTFANSLPGPPSLANPSSKVSTATFEGCGYELKSGSPICLWGFGPDTDGNNMLAVSSIQYRRIIDRLP